MDIIPAYIPVWAQGRGSCYPLENRGIFGHFPADTNASRNSDKKE